MINFEKYVCFYDKVDFVIIYSLKSLNILKLEYLITIILKKIDFTFFYKSNILFLKMYFCYLQIILFFLRNLQKIHL